MVKIIEHGGQRFVQDGFAVWQVGPAIAENLRRCYELSASRVAAGPDGHQMMSGYTGAMLVNGTIQGPGLDPIGHAWVIEPDGSVWEPASAEIYPAHIFEALFGAVVIDTYTTSEARMNMYTSGHYGPWSEEAMAS